MSLKRFILDSLKTKFAGIDEKVLDRIATKLAKTVESEEEAKTLVEETTLQQVIDSYTDSRVTDAQIAAVKKYEEKNGLKDGKPIEKPDDHRDEPGKNNPTKDEPQNNKPDDTPAYVKEMLDTLKGLNARMDAFESGRTANTREAQFDKLFEGSSDKLKEQYKRQYKRMTFKDDDDFASYLDEISDDVKSAKAAEAGSVGGPKAGSRTSKEQMSKYLQERVDARKAETATPAISGLPTK